MCRGVKGVGEGARDGCVGGKVKVCGEREGGINVKEWHAES